MATRDGYGDPPQDLATVTMCIKPVYNTHNILHKLPIFIEYHLGIGVEHFLFCGVCRHAHVNAGHATQVRRGPR